MRSTHSFEEKKARGGNNGEDVLEIEDGDLDERDIRPRSNDKGVWSPLLEGDFGGSNVVNVVFNEDKIVDSLIKKRGPRQRTMLLISGESVWLKQWAATREVVET